MEWSSCVWPGLRILSLFLVHTDVIQQALPVYFAEDNSSAESSALISCKPLLRGSVCALVQSHRSAVLNRVSQFIF